MRTYIQGEETLNIDPGGACVGVGSRSADTFPRHLRRIDEHYTPASSTLNFERTFPINQQYVSQTLKMVCVRTTITRDISLLHVKRLI